MHPQSLCGGRALPRHQAAPFVSEQWRSSNTGPTRRTEVAVAALRALLPAVIDVY